MLSLCYYGNDYLRKKTREIRVFDADLKVLISQMEEAMVEHKGVGLAAPQVGHLLRLFIVRESVVDEKGELQFGDIKAIINPKLIDPSKDTEVDNEGCLSIPGVYGDVRRPIAITVAYQDPEGNCLQERFEGFNARVIMHENDHLNGVLFIDRLEAVEKKALEDKLRLLKKRYK